MILSITGGRFHEPTHDCMTEFLCLLDSLNVSHLHHGASGAVDWGMSTLVRYLRPSIAVTPWPVDTSPSVDGPWPAAGCRRNGRMLRDSRSQAVAAFPGNRGTADCARQAKSLGLAIYRWIASGPASAAWTLQGV